MINTVLVILSLLSFVLCGYELYAAERRHNETLADAMSFEECDASFDRFGVESRTWIAILFATQFAIAVAYFISKGVWL